MNGQRQLSRTEYSGRRVRLLDRSQYERVARMVKTMVRYPEGDPTKTVLRERILSLSEWPTYLATLVDGHAAVCSKLSVNSEARDAVNAHFLSDLFEPFPVPPDSSKGSPSGEGEVTQGAPQACEEERIPAPTPELVAQCNDLLRDYLARHPYDPDDQESWSIISAALGFQREHPTRSDELEGAEELVGETVTESFERSKDLLVVDTALVHGTALAESVGARAHDALIVGDSAGAGSRDLLLDRSLMLGHLVLNGTYRTDEAWRLKISTNPQVERSIVISYGALDLVRDARIEGTIVGGNDPLRKAEALLRNSVVLTPTANLHIGEAGVQLDPENMTINRLSTGKVTHPDVAVVTPE